MYLFIAARRKKEMGGGRLIWIEKKVCSVTTEKTILSRVMQFDDH